MLIFWDEFDKFNLMRRTLILLFSLIITAAQGHEPSISSLQGFVENRGQILNTDGSTNEEVRYLLSTRHGFNVQAKSHGLAFDTYHSRPGDQSFLFHRLELNFRGSDESTQLLGRDKMPEKINVVRGKKRFENIGNYGEIIYKNLYPDIDLIAYAGESHFKYDFVLHEGADVEDIVMEYSGFDSYIIDSDSIIFFLSGRKLTEKIPESWLSDTGERIEVEYSIRHESEDGIAIGFEVCDDRFDRRNMVIDPEVIPEWSTYHGDSLYDVANQIVTDSLGFVFIAGTTSSIEMIASAGAYQSTYAGGDSDAFLTRMNQHGLRQWSTYYGGSGIDEGLGLCMNRYHHIVLVGRTNSTDSIASPESQQPSISGDQDGFIASFDRDGNLRWDTYFGGLGEDEVCDCHAYIDGSVIALGTSSSEDLFSSNGVVSPNNYSAEKDIFVANFNPSGILTSGNFYGGSGDDSAVAIDADYLGGFYIAANTNTPTGLATAGAYSTSLLGGSDGLILKLDTFFTTYWSSYFGGEGSDFLSDLVIEKDSDYVYIGGYTDGIIDLVVDSISAQTEPGGMEDGFLAKLSADAYSEWFTYSGGPQNDRITAVDFDIDSSLYAVGITASDTNIVFFDEDSVPSEFSGAIDSYLVRYDSEGPRVYSLYLGGEGNDLANGLAVYGRTAYFVVGATTSEANMVLTSDQQTIAHQYDYAGGGADAFFSRYTGLYSTDPCINCGGGGSGGGGGGGSGGSGGGGGENPGPPAVCLGDSILLNVGGGALGAGSQWIWYLDSCGGTDDYFDEGWSIWVKPDTTTTYFVRGESAERVSGCGSITVLVEDSIDVTASVLDSICAGGSLQFEAEGGLTYEWTGPDTLAFEGSNPILDSVYSYHLGWYHVTGTGLACTDNDSVEVEVIFPNPSVAGDVFNPTCVGLSDGYISLFELDSTITEFSWIDIPSDTLFRDSLADGSYPWTAENIYGCTSVSAFVLNEPTNPIDSLRITPDTCNSGMGTATVFLSTGWTEDFDLAWSTGLDSNIVNTDGYLPGEYTLELYNPYDCVFTDSFSIGNYGEFTTSVMPDSLYLEFQETAVVEVVNTPTQEEAEYSWTPPDGLSCFDCESPVVDPSATTWYVVEVTNQYGCTAIDSLFAEREIPPPTSFIPTIFSPNNDGLNDELCVLGNRILEIDFSVYNRWGEEVFATNNPESCWDGTHQGQPVTGSLLYTLRAVLEEGKTVEESGNIKILR